MKSSTLLLTLLLLIHAHFALAASPEEEARFVAAVKQAFEKHEAGALIALACWDRVSDEQKDSGKKRYAKEVSLTPTGFVLSAPDPKLPDVEWKDDAGVAYRSNLPVVKHLKITFAPGSTIELKRGPIKVKDVTYPVGEKEGRLFLLQPAPIK
jgi:hypothetical protein